MQTASSTPSAQTRKEKFLARMEQLMPWELLLAEIEPYYPKVGNGRRPYPLQTMLRVYLMQQWYNLSDPAMEDALYEIVSMRQFARLSLDQAQPDESTLMKFRHLLERHDLGQRLFDQVNRGLVDSGITVREGTLMDATIIEAPTSTKNQTGQRDPQMHPTKKGNQWHFGMKLHIGCDAHTGLCHSAVSTAANEHNLNVADQLLHGDERFVLADSGYRGAKKREALPKDIHWHIADQPSEVKRWRQHPRINQVALAWAHTKSSVRAKVEHPFRTIKRQFSYDKVRYRGLAKNLVTLLMSSNLIRVGQMAGMTG